MPVPLGDPIFGLGDQLDGLGDGCGVSAFARFYRTGPHWSTEQRPPLHRPRKRGYPVFMDALTQEIQMFTIGHSSHPLGTFIWLLRKHGIEALVDIRRYPGSKRHPHFSRENLAGSLAEEDIEYHWLEALGGHREKSEE